MHHLPSRLNPSPARAHRPRLPAPARNAGWRAWLLALALAFAGPLAQAEERRVVGPVTEIKVASDGKSATATIRDSQSGQTVLLQIDDDETLDKFKDQRISEGDEVRARYESVGGSNRSRFFRRTSGC